MAEIVCEQFNQWVGIGTFTDFYKNNSTSRKSSKFYQLVCLVSEYEITLYEISSQLSVIK